jgi:lysozyme
MRLKEIAIAVISATGLNALMAHEGVRLRAYQDEAGVWTICYGHTKGVYAGMVATQAQCEDFLRADIKWAEYAVNSLVVVPLTQNQFDALVSFVFNVGYANFKDSTLLKRLNAGDYAAAAQEFPKWSMLRDKKTGKKRLSQGLLRRRMDEQTLFLKP